MVTTAIPLVTKNHQKASQDSVASFNNVYKRIIANDKSGIIATLPVIGLCHSLGGKLTSLFSSTDDVHCLGVRRKANIFLAFNNFGFRQSTTSSNPAPPSMEFVPSPEETWRVIQEGYRDRISSSALIKFVDDTIDQSVELKKCLGGDSHTLHVIAGDHLQPNKLLLDEAFLLRLNHIMTELITS